MEAYIKLRLPFVPSKEHRKSIVFRWDKPRRFPL